MNLNPPTTVCHVGEADFSDPRYVYCGRRNNRKRLPQSPYANPFRMGSEKERGFVIEQFRAYWYAPEQAELRAQARRELPGKVLVCWCYMKACHCDVIAEYVNGEK